MEAAAQNEPTYQHDAFISYSRKNTEFAARLEKTLERYKPPKDLRVPQRHLDIFRDEEDFTGIEYHRSLEKQLAASAKLIVVCSPDARRSQYVNEEIEKFAKLRGADNIVPILLSGIPNNEVKAGQEDDAAFPPALCAIAGIPLAADFRSFGPNNLKLDGKGHQHAWYKTLADLYGLERAEVEQRDKKRLARTRRVRTTVAGTVVGLLSIAMVIAWHFNQTATVKQREARQLTYDQHIDLAKKAYESTNLPGMVEYLKADLPAAASPASDLRGFEWYYLWRLGHSGTATEVLHDDSVRSVAFSPDGKWIATGNAKGVTLWSAASHEKGIVLSGQEHDVTGFAFSPDGKTLATAGPGLPVRLWDVGTGNVTGTIDAFGTFAESVSYSRNGRYVMALGHKDADKIAKVWDTSARTIVTDLLGAGTASWSGLFAAFSPNATTLALSSFFGLEVFRIPSGSKLDGFADLDDFGRDCAVAFSPDGRTLAAGSDSGKIVFYDTSSGRAANPFDAHDGAVQTLDFSPDGKILASAGADQTVKLWDVATRKAGSTLRHAGSITDMAFAPDGKLSTASDKTLRLWEVSSRPEYEDVLAVDTFLAKIAPSPRTGHVAVANANGIVLWDTSTRKTVARLEEHESVIHDVALAPDRDLIAIGSDDGLVELWEAPAKATVKLAGHTGPVYGVAFSPDGRLLASASGDHGVRLWDVASRRQLPTSFTGHTDAVSSVAFSPDGTILATGSNDRTIRLWDVASGHQLASAPALPDTFQAATLEEGGPLFVTGIAFSADGQRVVAGMADGTAKVWRTTRHGLEVLATLAGHKGPINDVALSPDGRTIATASEDTTVKLWDTLLGRELLTLWESKSNRERPEVMRGMENVVVAVAFSGDGRTLLSGLNDGTVRVRRAAEHGADSATHP